MEGPSAATKRGHKVVSRRLAPTNEEVRPLVPSKSPGGGKSNPPGPPRSGQFGVLPQYNNTEKDDHNKRRYRVNVPYRMLCVLAMVFLLIPLLIFFYKETHIHKEHDHFKPERYVNVNTQDVLSKFSNHAAQAKLQSTVDEKEDEKKSVSSLDKDEEEEDHQKVSVDSASEDKVVRVVDEESASLAENEDKEIHENDGQSDEKDVDKDSDTEGQDVAENNDDLQQQVEEIEEAKEADDTEEHLEPEKEQQQEDDEEEEVQNRMRRRV